MKRIGIIGGMSYESTLHYYEQINRQVNERAGGLASADLALRSVNFEEYHKLMEQGTWQEIGHKLNSEARTLVIANRCDYVAIATNTMHKALDQVSGRHEIMEPGYTYYKIGDQCGYIKLVHIGDCIAEKCKEIDAKRVLLLGTEFTMVGDFMKRRLAANDIEVMPVDNYHDEIKKINRIIFEELCRGMVTPESKEFMMNFIWQFPSDSDSRPDAIILGCTELNMIITPDDIDLPLIDSTKAHVDKIVELCLED